MLRIGLRFWFVAAVAAPLFFCGAANAACNPPLASIRVEVNPVPLEVSRSLSIAKLSQRHRAAGVRADLAKYEHALGLTEAAVAARGQSRSVGEKVDGKWCVSVEQLTVTVGWASRVYIASEIVKNSCVWDAIVRHENKHVAVNNQLMRTLPDYFQREISRRLAAVVDTNYERAKAKVRKQVDDAINAALKSHQAYLDSVQEKIDTPEEYDRLPRECGRDAVSAILRTKG